MWSQMYRMAHLRKKKGLGNFSILFLTQCTVMIFAGKGDILTKPIRRGKGICLFFGREFDFGKEKWGEITGEDIKLDREMISVTFFSTDTATALRAVEVSADVMFKATMVDGVYDKDPHKYPDAKKYDTLTFTKVLEDQLAVMDGTAATLCRDNKLPILVFDLADPDNIAKAVQGENVGTLVYEG